MKNELVSEIQGVVDLIQDFRSEALLPVFEAVVNSIQAIEDAKRNDRGHIKVVIKRNIANEFCMDGCKSEPVIESFEIIDDGVGFTVANQASFMKFGSKYKIERGGKGIGRFTWLKAFSRATIDSVFIGNEGIKKGIKISFCVDEIKMDDYEVDQERPIGTKVVLENFKKDYRTSPSACRTGQKVAQRITEHCLFYLMTGKCPEITVQDNRPDGTVDEINLDKEYDEIKNYIEKKPLEIDAFHFDLYHLKLYSTNAQLMHKMVLCANGREVLPFDLKKEFGTGAQFDEKDKKFTYAVYVTGQYLDSHVTADRRGFNLGDDDMPLMADSSIGMNRLKSRIVEAVRENLKPYLESIDQKRAQVVQNYVSTKNPALRFVPNYCPEVLKEIDPNTSEAKIDEVLYAWKGKAEFELRKKSAALMKTHKKDRDEIVEEIKKIEGEITDVQKSNLANYILFRKMIIDLLDKKLSMCDDGKLAKEAVIHDIFMPRKAITDDLDMEGHNLWLLDERLTFHHFAASDQSIKQNMISDCKDRPDIVLFSDVDEQTRVARNVVIVELKRPERESYSELVSDQVFRMRDEIDAGKTVRQPNGRKLVVNGNTRYYCYALCDTADKVQQVADRGGYEELPANLGYFKYIPKLRMACYIINFDKIVLDAKQRHFAFFHKLGIDKDSK